MQMPCASANKISSMMSPRRLKFCFLLNFRNHSLSKDSNPVLEDDLKPIAAALAQCHTIWILGDLRAPDDESTTPLDEFAKVIANYCSSPGQPPHDPLVIELEKPAARSADRKLKSTAVRRMKLIHLDEPGGKDQDSRGM
jgi:hypothetical protein